MERTANETWNKTPKLTINKYHQDRLEAGHEDFDHLLNKSC